MHQETSLFLKTLFERCQHGDNSSCLTLTAIHPDGAHPTPSCHIPLGDAAALDAGMERLLRANARGWGAYIGVATRQKGLGRWSRGGKDNLVELPALFVDIDDPGCALWHLTFFEPSPSIILHSGRGYHAYWMLDKPTTDFTTADHVLKELAHRLEGDPALSVAQSMRLPGTLNTKAGREGELCHIVRHAPECQYTLSEFIPFLPPPPPPTSWHRSWFAGDPSDQGAPAAMVDAVTEAVIRCLDGRPRHNGYIAARCPLPHIVDRPGMHFSYDPRSGFGFCFGKHGKIPFREMCRLMSVSHR